MQVSFANKQLFLLDEVESTNSYASTLPADVPEGSIIQADFQSQGRGQGSNFWESEKFKNLTFSVLLHPFFVKASDQFYLSKTISLALADLISLYTDNVSIKWPNDIYVNDKKIAGILIENAIESDYISNCIVGIGLNINQDKFLSNAPNPVSLKQITGEMNDINEIREIFIDILAYRYSLLQQKEYALIDQNYLDFLYKLNKLSQYEADNKPFRGTIIGIEPTGELIIEEYQGELRKFWYKEVTFL